MKRKIRSYSLAAATVLLVFSLLLSNKPLPVQAANIVQNPGFESDFASWTQDFGNTSITTDFHTGAKAARIGTAGGGKMQPVTVNPNTVYILSGWGKVGASGEQGWIGIKNDAGWEYSLTFSTTTYTYQEVQVTTPASASGVKVYIWKNAGTGSYFYADDISLDVANPTPTNTSFPTATPHTAATFYVSPSGNDNNVGTSQAQAWQTVARVNSASFIAGDQVLFQGGQTFAGPVLLGTDDNGASGNPIIISSYGTGRAVISGGSGYDTAGSGIVLNGSQWVNVNNINVTGQGRTTNNHGAGVYTLNFAQHINIDHVDASGFQQAGVNMVDSSYVNVTYVNASYNGRSGIEANGQRPYPQEVVSTNIYVGYSTANHNDGDPTILDNWSGSGIVLGGVKNSTIEYSLAAYNGCCMPWGGNGPVGIWMWSADNTIIQYNISHHNTSPSGIDGGGYDIDGGTKNSIIQYNYSYNNAGAGYLAYSSSGQNPPAGGWETYSYTNNVFRYNISKNDGQNHGAGIYASGAAGPGISVYGNTVVETGGSLAGLGGSPTKNYNNIYYANSGSGRDSNGNWYVKYGQSPSPLLVNPGVSDSLEDPLQFSTLTAYQLQSSSPCINNGVDLASKGISNPGTHDFWGNAIPNGVFDIGAHEYTSGPTPTPTNTPTTGPTPTRTNTPIGPTPTPTNTPVPTNLLTNPGFETGSLSPWYTWGAGSVINSNAHSGTYSARLSGSNSGVQQDNIPVSPNTTYILTGWAKVSKNGNTVNIGVKNFGGTEQYLAITSTSYQQKTITFTTGASNTTASVYCWKSAGSNYAYCDDFTLVRQ